MIHKIAESYYPDFHSILTSMDGGSYTIDDKRGKGVQKRAMTGAGCLRASGFDGDLIARMTVTSDSSIYEDVRYLVEHDEPEFDHIHWQLDALWDNQFDDTMKLVEEWLLERYNPGISDLVDYRKSDASAISKSSLSSSSKSSILLS